MGLVLDNRDLLPVEVHDADLDDIRGLFGSFQRTDRRMHLFQKLTEYVDELRRAGIRGWLIVDGSFVMKRVDEPDDIDVILVFAGNWDFALDLSPFQYNVVSKRDVKRKYPIDVFPAIAGTESETKWIDFFQTINIKWYEKLGYEAGDAKGLVRIAL